MMRLLALTILAVAALAQAPAWRDADTITPEQASSHMKGVLFVHVGFPVLYRGAHIPGSVYEGPGSKPEGIELLKKTMEAEPRGREIVLYCGCCPWEKCPNMRPAFQALRGMGFTNVKAMAIPENFKTNWDDKGYPVEKSAERPAQQ